MSARERRTTPITLSLSPALHQMVASRAAKDGTDLLGAVEAILRDALMAQMEPDARRQLEAETRLMDAVENIVAKISQSGGWDEHVTATVFEKIAQQHLDLYREAVGGDPYHFGNAEKARINKRIGLRIKRLLDAEIVMSKGVRAKGQPSRKKPTLIMSYTLLRPSKVGKHGHRQLRDSRTK